MHNIKIHVHPRPNHNDYDYHLPMYGAVTNPQAYCNNLKKLVPVNSEIVLTSNGEPDQRLLLAQRMLSSEFNHIRLEDRPPCYAKDDALFQDKLFIKLPKKDKNFQSIVDYYLAHYTSMLDVQGLQSEADPLNFKGLVRFQKLIWYHYGRNMPVVNHDAFNNLNELLDPVFCDLVQCLQTQIDGLGLSIDVEKNLVFRLNHSEPNTRNEFNNRFLVLPHIDNTSILTTWIWASHPGATLYQDRDTNYPQTVSDLHDQNTEYCIMPGMEYCDFSSSMKPGTWHGVEDMNTGQHRVGFVGFLRPPHLNALQP